MGSLVRLFLRPGCRGGILALAVLAWAGNAWALAREGVTEYSIPSDRARHSLLLDVVRAGARLVTAGERGHILYSDDDGRSWTQARVPTRQLLTALFFIDAQRGWAVGHDALILASQDGGATWALQHEDRAREAPLLDVWFLDAAHGFAAGAYGMLLETRDGGRSWSDIGTRLDNPDGYHLNAIAEVAGSGLFLVGEAGLMFRSADRGQRWQRVAQPYQGSLFGLLATGEPGGLLVFGLRGHLFRSDDFGDSWQRIELRLAQEPLRFGLSAGSRLADGTLIVVGQGGSLLISRDGGHSFSASTRPDRLPLSALAEAADGRLILVGQGGVHVVSP